MHDAAWYVFTELIAVIYFAKGARKDVYERPILYEATSDKELGIHAPRKLGIFSVLSIQNQDEDGKKVPSIRAFQVLGGPGIFLGILLISLLVGSVAMILVRKKNYNIR